MLSSILKALASFKKPSVLLPAVVAAVAQFAIYWLVAESYFTIFLDALNEQWPNASAIQFPFVFYQQYANEFNALFIAWLAGTAIQLWLLFVLSRYVREQSVSKSVSYANRHFGQVISTIVFFSLVAFLLFSVYLLVSWIGQYNALASSVLLISLSIIALYATVKFSFFVTSMALDEVKLKQSLQRSWNFTKGRFWSVIILLLVLSLIGIAFSAAAGSLNDESVQEAALAAAALLGAVSTTWTGLALGYYYQQKAAQA